MTRLIAEKSIEINAQASRVWEILTKPEFTSDWSGLFGAKGPIDSDWTPGHDVVWRNAEGVVYVTGRVLACEPGKLLRFTVRSTEREKQPLSGRPEDDLTQTYALVETDGRTTLSTAHGDFSKLAGGEQIYPTVLQGWDIVLARLKDLAENAD
jgi:uncharacterized protein YndB with AHSA1/START domain